MIVYLPFVAFVVGALLAYGSAGVRRQAGTIVMLLAVAWALALLVDAPVAAWAVAPALATLLLRRPAVRAASTFEVLTRRTITIAGLALLALFLSSHLPVGENPLLLNAVPWLLGAVGTAWMLSPIDAGERLQGEVLMVAATSAVIITAIPSGPATAAAAGAMSIMPVIGQAELASAAGRQLLSSLVLAGAALAALLALSGISLERQSVWDIGVSFNGPVLLGIAVVLLAAALTAPPGNEWTGLLAAVALVAVAPSLRWSAIAALVAVATLTEPAGERPAWLALASFAAMSVVQGLAPPLWSLRLQAVALGIGLVLTLYAARTGLLRAVVLPAIGFLSLLSIASLTSGNLTRLQWITAVGALLLIGRALLLRAAHPAPPAAGLTDPLLMGLVLLSAGARDALSLGALATALLLFDLAIVRPGPAGIDLTSFAGRLTLLARSNWPPAITFAGATLAVIAALQASLALGLLAAILLAALQLAPLVDRPAFERMTERPISAWRWLGPVVSLGFGVAPSVVLRMLRL